MKILFLHGWQSVPGGVKPTHLRDNGFEVINPKLNDDDFGDAVRTAQAAYDEHRPELIVGSSRGGAVAMNLEVAGAKLILLCPAWRRWGSVQKVSSDTVILHSQADDVIPYEDSVELARNSAANLIEVGRDHRLADAESLSVLVWACNLAAAGETLSLLDDQEYARGGGKSDVGAEASYLCDSCGEEIVVPLDLTEGSSQSYVEDCPVCCRANIIHVAIDAEGNPTVYAEPEQN
jgi:hypothetical protein